MMKTVMCFFVALAFASTAAQADTASAYVTTSANKFRVAPAFALRVAQVESGNSCSVVGRHGEVGPLQILPSTARSMGYKNIRKASCQVKAEAGVKYLARCFHGARGDWRRAAACHNAGEASLKWRRYPASVRKYVALVVK